jgi:hypothetical protein
MSQGDWRNWGNHPLAVGVTVAAAFLSIYSYFENRKLLGIRTVVPVEVAQQGTTQPSPPFESPTEQKKPRPLSADLTKHQPAEPGQITEHRDQGEQVAGLPATSPSREEESAPAITQPEVERVDDPAAAASEDGLANTASRWLGLWEGEGTQFNSRQRWSIQMDLTSESLGRIVGSIRYPSLSCGGDLILTGADEDAWTMREHITYGSNCYTGGTITLVPQSTGRAQWLWHYPQGELGAQAEVRKRGE